MSLYLGETPICGGIESNQLNNPFSLLDYKFSEYEIINASWLRSNGQFNSGEVYSSVYNLLQSIKNGTETKAGVSVKLSTEAYTDTDFVINTADTTFRLPVKVKLASGNRVAGNGMTLGLTNGKNNVGMSCASNGNLTVGEGLYNIPVASSGTLGTRPAGVWGITTDPTKSGIETSSSGLKLYFYVGETVQDANLINAGQVLNDVANLKAHYIVDTYVNGTSWYRVWSDGWIEQGGKTEKIGDGGTATVTLLKNFTNTSYSVTTGTSFSPAGDDGGWMGAYYVHTMTVSNFKVYSRSSMSGGRYVFWSACGF